MLTSILTIFVVLAFAVTVAGALAPKRKPSPFIFEWASPEKQVNEWVLNASRVTGVSAAQIKAIMYIESRGNPNAVNPSDPSFGLMQLILPTARAFGGERITQEILLADPQLNTTLGARFLAELEEKFSRSLPFSEWAVAYNLGEPKFRRGVRNPDYRARVKRRDGQRVWLGPGELEAAFEGSV